MQGQVLNRDRDTLRLLRNIVKQKLPVVITGSKGIGKLRLVKCLAEEQGRQVVQLQLGKSTDSNDLVGSYE